MFAFPLLFILAALARSDTHVVIVAGSNGYQNYRHQADVCHAYSVLRSNGISADNIITLAFDDVANNEGNPFPGKLFNTVDGDDVYHDCVLDYTGDLCSMNTFFRVLHGNSSAQVPKVLTSNGDDNVFVVYTDHGAPGYVTFPAGTAMYASDLNGALHTMHTLDKYGKLLMYMDACNSGSMFGGGLLRAPNILAVTAASKDEESFAAFCPPYDKVLKENSRETFSCLGDVFSINWMLDTVTSHPELRTIGNQVDLVSNQTSHLHILNRDHNSHVQTFGDMSIRSMLMSSFQGNSTNKTRSIDAAGLVARKGPRHAVSTRDVSRVLARQTMLRLASLATSSKVGQELLERATSKYEKLVHAQDAAKASYHLFGQWTFQETMPLLKSVRGEQLMDENIVSCYRRLVEQSYATCEQSSDEVREYAMQFHGVFVHACDHLLAQSEITVDSVVSDAAELLSEACSSSSSSSKTMCIAKHLQCHTGDNDLAGSQNCCHGTTCTQQWTCPSGAVPRPGSKCGFNVPVKDCFTCEPPAPSPMPAGCEQNVGNTCGGNHPPCCVSKGRCSTFLHCVNQKCVFFPPPYSSS